MQQGPLDELTPRREVFGLAGQVAIVTGATSGLGRACAVALGAAGAATIVNHLPHSAEAAAEVCREIEGLGGRATPFPADVGEESQVAC